MGKRLVLIDENETKNYVSYFGLGLDSSMIILLQQLDRMSDQDRDDILRLGPGDGVLLVGAEPFKYLQTRYHFGIRGENYFDCSKLSRLSIEGGAFVKVILDPPSPEIVSYFLSDEFAAPVDISWFKQKIIHTYEDAVRFLDYMDSLPEDTPYGFDYEASGMPLDKWFELSGAALCTYRYGGFISFTDLRHNSSQEEYADILDRLGKFLTKRMSHVWTYNMQYEFQVSKRMLGVDLYNLCDASVFNILDGYHLKKYSLKWTANRVLGTTVWDTEFDRISDLIDSMLFETVGKLKRDRHKVLKVDQTNYDRTPEWQELISRYPEYESEFRSLILEYWGNPFMCIPSNILGYYCNLDAFYTLMIYLVGSNKEEYKNNKQTIEVFLDNTRLATRLHSCGIPKWEEYREEYHTYCEKMMAWGITYCAEVRCSLKMKKHGEKMGSIDKYNPTCRKLIKGGNFKEGDPIEILKFILLENLDTSDSTDTGVDEGRILIQYGAEFAESFIGAVKEAMIEVKMKTKIDDGIVRKKKFLGVMSEKLKVILGLDKIKIDNKLIELEKYSYYENIYNSLKKISDTQLKDINNIPNEIYGFGKKFTLIEYSDYISDNFFKCKSPIENDEICKEFASEYTNESVFLAALTESVQQMPDNDKFYKNRGINSIQEAYQHFMNQAYIFWQTKYGDGSSNGIATGEGISGEYPSKIFDLAIDYLKDLGCDQIKDVWSNFSGVSVQLQFFPEYSSQYEKYSEPFAKEDLDECFGFMRKFTLNYLLYKKYAKVLSTYIDGMFLQKDRCVIEDPESHIMLREADPDEPGAIVKMNPHFECQTKSSKRWSSGYHTIISHSDIKSTIRAYPGHLLSYFDIDKLVSRNCEVMKINLPYAEKSYQVMLEIISRESKYRSPQRLS